MTSDPTNENVNAIDDSKRKELVDYYKWIVNLAVFVLTISASISGLVDDRKSVSLVLVTGWSMLGASIFFNWLIVKNLIWYPALKSPRLGIYGSLQNWTFLIGVALVIVGYANNFGHWTSLGGIGIGLVLVVVLWIVARMLTIHTSQESLQTVIEGRRRQEEAPDIT